MAYFFLLLLGVESKKKLSIENISAYCDIGALFISVGSAEDNPWHVCDA